MGKKRSRDCVRHPTSPSPLCLLPCSFPLSIDDVTERAPVGPGQSGQAGPAHGTEVLLLEPLEDAVLAEDVRALQDDGGLEAVEADGAGVPGPEQVLLPGRLPEQLLPLRQATQGQQPPPHGLPQELEAAVLLVEEHPPDHPHGAGLPSFQKEALHEGQREGREVAVELARPLKESEDVALKKKVKISCCLQTMGFVGFFFSRSYPIPPGQQLRG